jgi:c(7)-type cytochrome triheme protein
MLRLVFSVSLVFVAAFGFLVASTPSPQPPQPIEFNHKLHLDYFQDGRHRQSMVSMHRQVLGEAAGELLQQGLCTMCHGDLDRAAERTPKIQHCAECHRVFLDHEWEGRSGQRPCMGCHNTAVDSPRASIPNTSTCTACHQPPLGGDHEEMKLLEFVEQERTIPWARVYDYLPGEVVFSHERHAELGRVRCQECHGAVERAEEPLSLEVKLSMEDCMACHEASGANNDCLACHK